MKRGSLAIAGTVLALLTLTGFGPPDPADVTDAELAASITPFDTNVSDVASKSRDGADEVIRLSADILFAFGKSALSDRGAKKIAGLLVEVPRGAGLSVGGHTDSIGSSAANQRLSLARARAVAAAIARARPDLRLDVRGYGETRPIAPNRTAGQDDPAGRAENRRVELRYRG